MADRPFMTRPLDWDSTSLPVPAELVVYTMAQWYTMKKQSCRFFKTVERETVWVFKQ